MKRLIIYITLAVLCCMALLSCNKYNVEINGSSNTNENDRILINNEIDNRHEDDPGIGIEDEDGVGTDATNDQSEDKNDDVGDSTDVNDDETDKKDENPTVIEYVTIAPGKFIYASGGLMDANNNNNNTNVLYELKNAKQSSFISNNYITSKQKSEALAGTRVYSILGKNIPIDYINSKICVDNVGKEVSKYKSVHVYQGEGKTLFEFSAETNQLTLYYNPSVAKGFGISEEEAHEICDEFVESQLGDGILSAYSKGCVRSGDYFSFLFTKQIAGFDTTDRINVVVSALGEIKFYSIKHIGAYNGFEDEISFEDVAYTVEALSDALYTHGVKTLGYSGTSLVLDAEGILYAAVTFKNGVTYYAEILESQ